MDTATCMMILIIHGDRYMCHETDDYWWGALMCKLVSPYWPSFIGRVLLHTSSYLEESEDTEGVIRNRKSKDRQHNGQKWKIQKGQTMTHKTQYIKLKMEYY